MRLPRPAPLIAIYLALVAINVIPSLTHQQWFAENYWFAAPFRAAALMLPVMVFTSAFVVKKWIVLLVPAAGILLNALLLRYAAQFPNELSDTLEPGFASVVWEAFKLAGPVAIVIVGFGILSAMHWAPRAGIDGDVPEIGPARMLALLPPPREVIVAFLVFFALAALPDLVGRDHFDSYISSFVITAINLIAGVLMFFAVFTANSWWSAIFPAMFVALSSLVVTLHGGCGQDEAWLHCFAGSTWFTAKFIAIAYAIVFFIALLAAQWARPSAEVQSSDESGEHSINSSLLPAGSDT